MQVGAQLIELNDAAVLLLAARALLGQLLEVLLGRLVADGDVYLALG